MTARSPDLQSFIGVLGRAAVAGSVELPESRPLTRRLFAALDEAATLANGTGAATLPACRHLDTALENARGGLDPLPALADAFARIAPSLRWQRRSGSAAGDAGFHDGHANAQIVGPAGLERRADVVVGVSLVAPGVRYPDHRHPPEELYVVMSAGQWYREKKGWYTPGRGAVVHHPPGVLHAMRAGADPLLAIWCLWTGE